MSRMHLVHASSGLRMSEFAGEAIDNAHSGIITGNPFNGSFRFPAIRQCHCVIFNRYVDNLPPQSRYWLRR